MIYMLILLNIMKKENIPGCAESATIENTDKFRHSIIYIYVYLSIYLFFISPLGKGMSSSSKAWLYTIEDWSEASASEIPQMAVKHKKKRKTGK